MINFFISSWVSYLFEIQLGSFATDESLIRLVHEQNLIHKSLKGDQVYTFVKKVSHHKNNTYLNWYYINQVDFLAIELLWLTKCFIYMYLCCYHPNQYIRLMFYLLVSILQLHVPMSGVHIGIFIISEICSVYFSYFI